MLDYELYLTYYEWGNLKFKLKEWNIEYTINNQNTEGIDITIKTTPVKTKKVFDYVLSEISCQLSSLPEAWFLKEDK